MYTGFFCLRRAASDAAVNTVVFLKLRDIYWLGEQLLPRIEDTGLLELAANGLVALPQFRKKRCCTESCMQQDEKEDKNEMAG